MGAAGGGWRDFFWAVFSQSTNPMILMDDERRIFEVNAATTEMTGFSREQMVGRSAGGPTVAASLCSTPRGGRSSAADGWRSTWL